MISCRAFLCIAILLTAPVSVAADQDIVDLEAAGTPRFFDPADNWLDIGEFLDTSYGFVPVVAPITEPAVGYGAAAALVFIDRNKPGQGQSFVRPNIAVLGALATENGTSGLFAGHLGYWMDGKIRTLVGLADADVNLEFFGLGDDRYRGGQSLDYTITARGSVVGGAYRLKDTPFWLGLRYALATTHLSLSDDPQTLPPGIQTPSFDLDLAALTPSITFDTRDNLFTPTRGWYLDLSVPVFRKAFGGDRDFEKASLTGIHYRPLADSVHFAARASVKASSDGTPFYLRPFVSLRGVQAMRYQGEQAAELEAELRWQLHPRFSLVGFGGVGIAGSGALRSDQEQTVTAGGAGLRYLLARKHGLHMGLDVAYGPDEPIFYVVFGNAWLRP